MATKKSSKSSKTKTLKSPKSAPVDHNHIGKCFVAFGLIITVLLFGFFYLLGQRKTYAEQQKLLAFDGLVETFLYDEFTIDGEQTATITGSGLTEDKDLYYDFVITKYENHTPTAEKKARLHFQCNEKADETKIPIGCAHAYWYGEWESVSEK